MLSDRLNPMKLILLFRAKRFQSVFLKKKLSCVLAFKVLLVCPTMKLFLDRSEDFGLIWEYVTVCAYLCIQCG